MATRLYPNTDNPRILEHLAGVPTGTMEKLKALENQEFADDYAKHLYINSDPHLGPLDAFLTFGWGRLQYCPEGHDPCGDSTKLEHLVMKITQAHNITQHMDVIMETGGLRWS